MKLAGGNLNEVVRVGDTVRRPTGPWTPAVHALLHHFAEAWGLPTDRRGKRMRLLCDAYGLDRAGRHGLIDALPEQRQRGLETHRLWGGIERRPGWAQEWDDGSEQRILANLRFVEDHREELEAWLR